MTACSSETIVLFLKRSFFTLLNSKGYYVLPPPDVQRFGIQYPTSENYWVIGLKSFQKKYLEI